MLDYISDFQIKLWQVTMFYNGFVLDFGLNQHEIAWSYFAVCHFPSND